ncbi:MAG: ABC transporter substrate-binding protein [Verrucomicrobia bacterium]|nr:ABC transporter substrate-binding protein [Verrucomicrobiota bacterium]
MRKRLISFIILLAIGFASAALCPAAGTAEAASSPPPLKVGVTPNAAPIVFMQQGKIMGIEADLAGALAKALNRKLEFVELEWNSQIPELKAGTIDIIMSGMSYTRTRAEEVAFTDPYLTVGQMVLIRRDDSEKYKQPEDLHVLRGRVGVEKGTTGQLVAERVFPEADIIEYSSPEETAAAIIVMELDAAVHDAPFVWWLASSHRTENLSFLPFALTEEYLAWAVRKDDAELLSSANRVLEEWRQNGELTETIRRWLPSGL